jgi:hypothetical protein
LTSPSLYEAFTVRTDRPRQNTGNRVRRMSWTHSMTLAGVLLHYPA